MLTRIGQAASTDAAPVADLDTALAVVVTAIAAITAPGAMPRSSASSTLPASATRPDASAPAQDEAIPAQSTPVSSQNMSTTGEDEPVSGLMPVPAQRKPVPVRDEPISVQNFLSPAQSRPELAPAATQEAADKGRMVRDSREPQSADGSGGRIPGRITLAGALCECVAAAQAQSAGTGGCGERLRESLAGLDVPERVAEHATAARRKVDECRHMLADRLTELELFAHRSENLSDRLYREAIASRMRPFDDGVQGFPRMVRDIARRLGKKVTLEIIGRGTEVDRDILEPT